MEIKSIKDWGLGLDTPMIISGPCSAESEDQVLNTCRAVAQNDKVNVLRAGIWKPRTRPGTFEGIGEEGLPWLVKAGKETGKLICTEVATPEHVEACLKHGVDILWIGARTTVNPFAVQAIADALEGVDIPVMVKNPINPDLSLWMGAMERIHRMGVNKIAAIHRGFSPFEKTPFRNIPKWSLVVDLKRKMPELDIVCDPSHIAGNTDLIPYISQKALDMDMAGLMIESHITPKVALSDAAQQVTPDELNGILNTLAFRKPEVSDMEFAGKLEEMRKEIDELDDDILHKIAARMQIAEKIGTYKKDNEVTILQVGRWEEIVNKRVALGKAMNLSDEFTKKLMEIIHKESIRKQTIIMNEGELAPKA